MHKSVLKESGFLFNESHNGHSSSRDAIKPNQGNLDMIHKAEEENDGETIIRSLIWDETADDEFCESLYQCYLNDPDSEKDMEYSLEDCKKEWRIV